ncbi:PCYCGC motif-containing (lipo)protein [Bacillus sp. FJAT-45350]|uniref:PCYCGC motif-containing (lipo)protein n=1 Tax=Bacillus sp. FJAT-45350 TaxID=2011014 RepID=UPI000BB87F95|nr:PCYCGC motif-containing (lipo)protein [Bacillus sp. FJAT-45350]
MKQLILLLIIAMLTLAGCYNEASNEGSAHDHFMGDIREATVSIEVLPTFLDEVHENIVSVYERVPHHQDVLEYIPCYCGCGDTVGHRDVYACFINEHSGDDSVVWDDHGMKCGVCLETAHYSMQMSEAGVSTMEIRQYIDESYKEGFAPPTKTPMPTYIKE